jgi:hypothetical protein
MCWLCVRFVALMWEECGAKLGSGPVGRSPNSSVFVLQLHRHFPSASFTVLFYPLFSVSFPPPLSTHSTLLFSIDPDYCSQRVTGFSDPLTSPFFFRSSMSGEFVVSAILLTIRPQGFAVMIVCHDEWEKKSFNVNSGYAGGRRLHWPSVLTNCLTFYLGVDIKL